MAPEGDDIRPTTDKTRTALFNALVSRNMVQDATVIDLFAGTGSLGIEALSRGATKATFIDSDRVSVDCIRYNLSALGFDDVSTVIRADVKRWLDTTGPTPFVVDDDSPLLILADPPYAYTAWSELFERLLPRMASLGVDALLVIESGKPLVLPDGWDLEREARYGAAYVTFTRPHIDGQGDDEDDDEDGDDQDGDEDADQGSSEGEGGDQGSSEDDADLEEEPDDGVDGVEDSIDGVEDGIHG